MRPYIPVRETREIGQVNHDRRGVLDDRAEGWVAREQRANALDLRALVSLDRLAHGAGTCAGTSRAHDWLTEGFDAIDLTEARAVLERAI